MTLRAIRRIADQFNWALFTPVTVSPSTDPGHFVLVDGQHRAHAAALAGLKNIPAAVVEIPPIVQARVFAGINSQRTAMSALNVYRAALAGRERWALEAEAAADAAGCRLMQYNASAKNKKPKDIYAIAVIRDQLRAGRKSVVIRGLKALSGSSAAESVALYQYRVLRPWLGVLAADPTALKHNLERFVSAVDLVALCDPSRSVGGGAAQTQLQVAMSSIRQALDGFDWSEPMDRSETAIHIRTSKPTPAPTAPPAPHGEWTEERDATLKDCSGTHRDIADLADEWSLPTSAVRARWHRVRVTS